MLAVICPPAPGAMPRTTAPPGVMGEPLPVSFTTTVHEDGEPNGTVDGEHETVVDVGRPLTVTVVEAPVWVPVQPETSFTDALNWYAPLVAGVYESV